LIGTKLLTNTIGKTVASLTMVAMLGLACGRPARAESQIPFPAPKTIQPNIDFWVQVFTAYSYRDFVILDRDNVWRTYQVYHLPGNGQPTRGDIEWANAYLKTKYGEILTRLASGHTPSNWEERRVAAMFKGEPVSRYAEAAQNLRVQEGLREQFREGLLRSRYYRPTMEKIFKSAGVPPELVTLAHVESGFHGGAKSGAGAVGIWQFTIGTGKQYMKITPYHDDRLNPVRETEAAAKLLRANYDTLGNWPLAIALTIGLGGSVGARAMDALYGDVPHLMRGRVIVAKCNQWTNLEHAIRRDSPQFGRSAHRLRSSRPADVSSISAPDTACSRRSCCCSTILRRPHWWSTSTCRRRAPSCIRC
jgi:hypothetical protein